ncbi:hypothetical protein LIER_25884 [Lithospermum erythrorhizon]|uniref:Uncharacterized protein n=1 Tax=Lithospermum erythrorhizon TaxID=34254 RepID=A0AAV3RA44_LITER
MATFLNFNIHLVCQVTRQRCLVDVTRYNSAHNIGILSGDIKVPGICINLSVEVWECIGMNVRTYEVPTLSCARPHDRVVV